jgi:hypothetical protein
LGNALYGNPSLGVFYTIQISVDVSGTASVSLLDSSGVVLASQSGLSVGNGPFYVVLAQKEGWPCVSGPLAATWQSINVTECSAFVGPDEGSPTWSGYVVGVPTDATRTSFQDGTVTDVKGTWTVPEISLCSANPLGVFATWVGIGGWTGSPDNSGDNSLVQIGISGYCNFGVPTYYAWYETIQPITSGPAAAIVFPNFPVSAGDKIFAEVSSLGNENYLVTIANLTQHTLSSEILNSPDNHAKTGEWIVECAGGAPVLDVVQPFLESSLADFGTVSFSDCSVTLNSEGSSQEGSINSICGAEAFPIMMGKNTVWAQTYDSLSSDGTSFSVTFNPESLNLSGDDLKNADLQGANLQGADLAGANLKEANLTDALLQDANLKRANLIQANLSGANLSGADLWGADLQGANLQNANFTDANLTGANLHGAITTGAIFTGVITNGCNWGPYKWRDHNWCDPYRCDH